MTPHTICGLAGGGSAECWGITTEAIASGDVRRTLQAMVANVRRSSSSPAIAAAAAQATAGARTREESLAGIFRWIQARVRYMDDGEAASPLGRWIPAAAAELLISPVDLVAMARPADDCDGFAQLAAALVIAAGAGEPRFNVIAGNQSDPENFSHVYVVVYGDGQRIALDASHGPSIHWEAAPRRSTRFGGSVNWVGKQQEWRIVDMPAVSLGDVGSLQDALINLIPVGGKIAENVVPRLLTPTGYYKQTGPNGTVETRQPVTASPFAFPGAGINLGGESSFPAWGWLVLIGGVAYVMGKGGKN